VSLARILRQCPVERRRNRLRHVRPNEPQRRRVARRGQFARECGEARRGQLPLVARRRWCPTANRPFRSRRRPPSIRGNAHWQIPLRNGPLPAEEPDASGRSHPDVLRRQRTVSHAGIVQVRDGRSGCPQEAQHVRHILRTRPPNVGTHGFPFDPSPQITRPAPDIAVLRPVMVRGRYGRVVAVPEVPSFRRQPRVVRRIRRRDQRQRSPQRVDDLLVMTILGHHTFPTPSPVRRQLPIRQMRRQLGCESVRPRVIRADAHRTDAVDRSESHLRRMLCAGRCGQRDDDARTAAARARYRDLTPPGVHETTTYRQPETAPAGSGGKVRFENFW
jgi:hypothetical protein